MNYEDLTKKQKKELAESSGYSLKEMEDEQPYLIPDEDFEDYVRELMHDTEDMSDFVEVYVDWGKLIGDLLIDYTEVEIDGKTYQMRM